MSDLGDAYADAHLDLGALDRDIDEASSMLRDAVARWEQLIDITGVINMDTDQASSDVEAAARDWERIVSDVSGAISVDTAAASAEIAEATDSWEAAAQISGNVNIDVGAATAEMQAASAEWESLATPHGNVDLDVTGATTQLETAAAGWRAIANGISTDVSVNTDGVLEQIVLESELWSEAANVTANVDVNLSGTESVAALVAAIRALDDISAISVTLELNEASVLAVTGEIEAIVATWSDSLKLTPTFTEPDRNRRTRTPRPGTDTPAQPNGPPEASIPVGIDTTAVDSDIRTITEEWKRRFQFLADIEIDQPKLAAEVNSAAATLNAAVSNIEALIDVDPAAAYEKIKALGPEFESLLGDITSRVSVDGDEGKAELRLILTELRFLADKEIQVPVGLDTKEAYSAAAQFKILLKEIERGIKANIKPGNFSGVVAAEAAIAELRTLASTINVDFDADTAGFLTDVEITKELADRIIGTIHSNLELDGTAGYLSKLASVKAATALISSGLGEGISAGIENSGNILTRAGDTLSGILGDIGQGLSKAASNLPAMAAQFAQMTAMFLLWVGVVAPLIAAAVVGVGALVGTAAGFVTLAASIGAAAGAAGLLGIALNKDLLARVKEGLDELKTGVAAVTRDAGEQLINKFQAPFIDVLTKVAASASKLTSVFVDPIATAALDWLRTFQSLLDTPAAAQFAEGLGRGIAGLIDTFNEFLPIFLEISNEVSGPLFDSLDAVIRMFLELGISGKGVFVEFFKVIEVLAGVFVDMGEKSLPVIESLLGLITDFLQSDFFGEFVDFLGIAGQLVVQIIEGFAEGFAGVDEQSNTTTRTFQLMLVVLEGLAEIAPIVGAGAAYFIDAWNAAVLLVGGMFVGLFELLEGAVVVFLELLGAVIEKAAAMVEPFAGVIPGAEELVTAFKLAETGVEGASDNIQGHMGRTAERFNGLVTEIATGKGGVEDFATSADGLGISLERAGDGAVTAQEAFDTLVTNAQGSNSAMGELVRQFETSGKAYADFRAELEKPLELELKVKFPDIKKIGDEIASQVKFTEKTIPAIPAGTEGAAGGGVSGSSGNGAIADALNQTQQEDILPEVPAETVTVLSKTFQQAVDETLKKANESVLAGALANNYEKAGQAGLAAIVRGLTGPELQQAYKEFGEPGSKSAQEFSDKFNAIFVAQTTASGGGITGAIDKLAKDIELKMKKLDYLKILDARGFDSVSAMLSGLTGPELEAAIKEIEAGGDAFLLTTENTIDKIREGAKAKLDEDPLNGLRDYAETISKNSSKAAEQAAREATAGITGKGKGKDGEEKPKTVADQITTEIGKGVDEKTSGKVAQTVIGSIVQQIETVIRGVAGPRLSVAGALLNSYFVLGVNSGFLETQNAPFAAAVVARVVAQLITAVDAVRPATTMTGGVLVANFADGITLAVSVALQSAAKLVVNTAQLIGDTALVYGPQLMVVGRNMAQTVIDGINDVAEESALATGAGFVNKLVEGLSGAASATPTSGGIAGIGERAANGARAAAEKAVGGGKEKDIAPGVAIGMAIGDGILAGIALRVPVIVAAVQALGDLIALTMKASLKIKSPSQVTMSIGEQVADGLAAGLDAGQTRAIASARAMSEAVGSTLRDGVGAVTVMPKIVADETLQSALEGARRAAVDVSPVLNRGAANLPESARLVNVQKLSVADPTNRGGPSDTSNPVKDTTANQAPKAAIHVDEMTVNVNGVRDPERVPPAIVESTETDLWRIGLGDSPRRT